LSFRQQGEIALVALVCCSRYVIFPSSKWQLSRIFSIKKAQNHWLAPRFFERIFNVRPRVISVTVSNYGLKVVKCCKMWYNFFKNFWQF
jgi:hypothetical protein